MTKSQASLLTNCQSFSSKASYYFRIDLKIKRSEFPLKGGYPQRRIYMMIPQDQMSALESYYLLMTSGAT